LRGCNLNREAHLTDEWTTTVPETYCIEYGRDHLGNAEYIAQIVAAPPTVVHVGVDTVINNMFGATDGDMHYERQLAPTELEARARDIRVFVNEMHAAGVKTLMPYQSGMFLFGDHEKRSVFWEFYDRWDDYADFGVGPRPATDPVEWPGNDRRPVPNHPYFVYEPCINHPDWRAVLRMTTAWAARVGYDALFSDVNSHHCYKPSCQAAFGKYLCAKYSPADLRERFGFAGPEEVRMGEPGDGLLWVETQRHWGNSFAEVFAELTAVGRQHVRGFFILPNSSSYANINEMYKRRTSGQNISMWARSCPILMYEKNEQPGRFGRTALSDSILQYKFAFANRIRAGVLLYNSQEPHSIALSNAEAAALGGGSFIQGHYQHPEVRMAYRRFLESSHDVLAGYSSHAQVGLVFFYEELLWENPGHLEHVFCLKDYLCNHHVLWDFVVEKTLAPHGISHYSVVIVPELQHLSDAQVGLLRDFAAAGGVLVMIGETGRFGDDGVRRNALPLENLLAGAAKGEIRRARLEKGWVVHAARIEDLIERPAFEIFQLTEDEANDTSTIIRMVAEAEASKEPRGKDRLLGLCEKLSGEPLSIGGEGVPFTLRAAAYRRSDSEGKRLTVHLLNYDVPIHGRQQSGPPVPAEQVALSIPMPRGWEPKEVRLRGPCATAGTSLPFEVQRERLHVTVPRVEVYELVEVVAG